MEDSEKCQHFKKKKRVQQSIIKSTCQKIVRKQHKDNHTTRDINNNENE